MNTFYKNNVHYLIVRDIFYLVIKSYLGTTDTLTEICQCQFHCFEKSLKAFMYASIKIYLTETFDMIDLSRNHY